MNISRATGYRHAALRRLPTAVTRSRVGTAARCDGWRSPVSGTILPAYTFQWQLGSGDGL